jgi:hypothetical protein
MTNFQSRWLICALSTLISHFVDLQGLFGTTAAMLSLIQNWLNRYDLFMDLIIRFKNIVTTGLLVLTKEKCGGYYHGMFQ